MTSDGQGADLESTTFTRTARRLADEHHLSGTLAVVAQDPGRTSAEGITCRDGNRILRVPHDVLAADPSVQAAIAAHEIAHFVLGHPNRSDTVARHVMWALFPIAFLGVAVVLLLLGAPGAPGYGVSVVVALLMGVGLFALSRRILRRQEDEADDLAAGWGHPIDRKVVDFMRVTDGRTRMRWRNTHRLPEVRRARLADGGEDGEEHGQLEGPEPDEGGEGGGGREPGRS